MEQADIDANGVRENIQKAAVKISGELSNLLGKDLAVEVNGQFYGLTVNTQQQITSATTPLLGSTTDTDKTNVDNHGS